MIIYNIQQQSEAWFAARCGRVTGTRFKDLMAGETTDTYKKLITNLACEIITGKMEETYSNANMEHGVDTEPLVREEYESIFDVEVKCVGFIIPDEDHKYHELIGISPDGLLPDDGLLEIKCPLARTHLEYIEAGKLPTEYRNQIQGQLFVTGYKYCDFMSFVEGMKPFLIRVYPDLELFKEFEKRLDLLSTQVQNKLNLYKQYNYLHNE
jgi:putative phage-type endonuclease